MSKETQQHRNSQAGGGQQVGGVKSGTLHQPAKFLDKAGRSDNQSTNRGKGKS